VKKATGEIKRVPIIADLIVNVSAKPVGEFADWPANIQDGIFAALERLNNKARAKYGLPLVFNIIGSMCDYDEDSGYYIGVQARAWLDLQ
jgi:hypothetical protein